jgi:hypothetical protein
MKEHILGVKHRITQDYQIHDWLYDEKQPKEKIN